MRLQRRVIQQWNGNFVGFPRIILKIVKIYPMKHNLHLFSKWQNLQISQLPVRCKSEVIVLYTEITLVYDY